MFYYTNRRNYPIKWGTLFGRRLQPPPVPESFISRVGSKRHAMTGWMRGECGVPSVRAVWCDQEIGDVRDIPAFAGKTGPIRHAGTGIFMSGNNGKSVAAGPHGREMQDLPPLRVGNKFQYVTILLNQNYSVPAETRSPSPSPAASIPNPPPPPPRPASRSKRGIAGLSTAAEPPITGRSTT